jgi:hypothetical protein
LIFVFSLFLTINPNAKNYFHKNDQHLKGTVKYLTNLKLDGQIKLFESSMGLIFFLPENFKYLDVDSIDYSVENYLKEIDIIYFNLNPNNAPLLNDNPKWKHFVENYQSYGFSQLSIGFGYPLFIRNNLLIKIQ